MTNPDSPETRVVARADSALHSMPWYSVAESVAFAGGSEADALEQHPRYERVSLLGEGGMGRVWQGYDRHLQRVVALKEPRGSRRELRLLEHEAQMVARLSHPAIVRVYDILRDEDPPVFVMELVEGTSIRQQLQGASHEARSLLIRPFATACAAVGHAHAAGIIHRDLSPNNILIGNDQQAWVVDWGLAREIEKDPEGDSDVSSAESNSSDSGASSRRIGGTTGFIAPEVLLGGRPDTRSDVWSLGSILHRIVYGVPISEGIPGRSRVSPELAAVVLQACHLDRNQRYPDARALALDLQRWLDGRRVEAYAFPMWKLAWRVFLQWKIPITAFLISIIAIVTTLAWSARENARSEALARVAEREAVAQETRARQLLAEQYAQQGTDELRRGSSDEAERFANLSLQEHENANARGVLALAAARPSAQLLESVPYSNCEDWQPLDEESTGICITSDRVSLYRGTEELWSFRVLLPKVRASRDADGRTLIIVLQGSGEIFYLDAETGLQVRSEKVPSSFLHPLQPILLDIRAQRLSIPELPLPHCPAPVRTALQLRSGGVVASCGDGGALSSHPDGSVVRWPYFEGTDISIMAELSNGDVWAGGNSGQIAPLDASRTGFAAGEPVTDLIGLPDTAWLVLRLQSGVVRVLNTETGEIVLSLPGRHQRVWLETSREGLDGWVIGTFGQDGRTTFLVPGDLPRSEAQIVAGIAAVVWSGDSTGLFSVDGDGGLTFFPRSLRDPIERTIFLNAVAKTVDVERGTRRAWASGIEAHQLFVAEPRDDSPLQVEARIVASRSVRRLITFAGPGNLLWLDYGVGVYVQQNGRTTPGLLLRESRYLDLSRSANGRCVIATGEGATSATCLPPGELPPAEQWQWQLVNSDTGRAGAINDAGQYAILVDRQIRVGDLRINGSLHTVTEPTDVATPLDVVITDDFLIVGRLDGQVQVMTLSAPHDVIAQWQYHSARIGGLDVSPDGRWLVTAGWDGRIAVVDLSVLPTTRTP
jgi:serine/threonine protein kinase